MATTVEVRFKGNRKDYFVWSDETERLRLNDPVIVEAERGQDFGRVSVTGERAATKCAAGCGCSAAPGGAPTDPRRVVRLASQDEIRTANDLRRSEEETRRRAIERVKHHQLDMKVSDAEWQWDQKKLTFYFTAEKRVDFRNLVRDLASTFKTRIELRQIGVRDEAARLGGVGRCGKEYCCSTWLRELNPVSLSLAKDQYLSLNPAQISGGCGRLLCCLKYEHEFYVTTRKRFPKEGKLIRTLQGSEKVVAVDIFRERVFLRGAEGPRVVMLVDLKDEMERAAAAGPTDPATETTPARPAERERPRRRREDRPARPLREESRTDRPAREEARADRPTADQAATEPTTTPAPTGAPDTDAGEDASTGEGGRRRRRPRRRRKRRPRGSDGPDTPET